MNGLTKKRPVLYFYLSFQHGKANGTKTITFRFFRVERDKNHSMMPPPPSKKIKKIHNKRKLTSLNFKQKYHRGNCKAPVMFQKLNYWTCLQIFSNPSSPNAWYFINFNYNKVPCAFIITTEKCYCEQKYGNKHANDFFLRFG